MPTWDRKTPSALRKQRDALLLTQLRDAVAPFSPFWRERFQALGLKPSTLGVKDFARLPAVGERDVCPDADARSAAGLVLQATEVGYALHASGPALRRALGKRLLSGAGYRAQIETDTRPTHYAWTGHGVRFPVASTRSDLDLIARAGARLWSVLGLTNADLVLDATPLSSTPARTALDLAAIAAGSPTFRTGPGADEVIAAARLVPVTALVSTPDAVVDLLAALAKSDADLTALRTVVLLGAPTQDDRLRAVQALGAAGAPADAVVVACYAPAGARVLWGECRESARAGRPTGFHSYPDLDLLELVDPATAEPATAESASGDAPAELVLTQLGFRGSALLRWRTADLVDAPLSEGPCPSCGRTTARVSSSIRPGALATRVKAEDEISTLDLRGVTGALAGRGDLADWRVVLRRAKRSDRDELIVYAAAAAGADEAEVSVGLARDIKVGAGVLPTQIVSCSPEEFPTSGRELGARVLDAR